MTEKNKKLISIPKSTAVFFIIEIVLIAIIGVVIGLRHEPWADEAQSWLLARDNDWLGVFKAIRYEGTPPLWVLIIKLFMTFGLKYEGFFIIPLTLTLLGTFLLLFYVDASVYFKALFPFTFYVLYQSAIVARSYSLVFPILMLIVIGTKLKEKTCVPYFIGLLLISLTSAYGIVIAGSFMLTDALDIFKIFHMKELKDNRKYVFEYLITGLCLLIVFISIIPPADQNFRINIATKIYELIPVTFLFKTSNIVVTNILNILLIIFFVYYSVKAKELVRMLLLTVPSFIFISTFHSNIWHYTNMYFIVVAAMLIYKPEFEKEKFKEKGFINTVMVLIILSQIALSGYCLYQDYFYPYSGSKEATEYVKKCIEEDKTIYSPDYYGTSLQPYFDKNIYINHPETNGYYFWSFNNYYNDINNYSEEDNMDIPDIISNLENKPDIIVCRDKEENTFEGYKKRSYDGTMFYKNIYLKRSAVAVWEKE